MDSLKGIDLRSENTPAHHDGGGDGPHARLEEDGDHAEELLTVNQQRSHTRVHNIPHLRWWPRRKSLALMEEGNTLTTLSEPLIYTLSRGREQERERDGVGGKGGGRIRLNLTHQSPILLYHKRVCDLLMIRYERKKKGGGERKVPPILSI